MRTFIHSVSRPRIRPTYNRGLARTEVENRSLIPDAGSLDELAAVVRDRIRYYNRVRRHSSSETGHP
ncbi:hypothetical protein [Candidatus Palauibacter sp.]|uniref:hypothetical protein n=1 Tax=Candidatus Palauibacter sp. TaxID=3101350 RepID=UPI003D0D3BDF